MPHAHVSVRFVDGGFQEWTKGQEFVRLYERFSSEGLTGRRLIDTLISDDWAAPPSSVTISGTRSSGLPFEVTIPYT